MNNIATVDNKSVTVFADAEKMQKIKEIYGKGLSN